MLVTPGPSLIGAMSVIVAAVPVPVAAVVARVRREDATTERTHCGEEQNRTQDRTQK